VVALSEHRQQEAAVNTGVYGFKLGKFDCLAVSGGSRNYAPPVFPPPAAFLFLNAEADNRDSVLSVL
jgi:hypothetical protein